MIIPAKNFGPHCTVEIVTWYDDGRKLTVYADNISEGMDLADEFYKLTEGIVEVCEMDNERWKLSYMIEPYHGFVKDSEGNERTAAEEWADLALEVLNVH